MTLEDAVKYLQARGLVAKIITPDRAALPYIMGGTSTDSTDDGIELFQEAFMIRPHEEGEGFVASTAHPGQVGQHIDVSDLKTAADVIYTIYRQRGLVPAVPTSGSWEGDAQALLDMGAKKVDADTVAGLVKELRQHRLALGRIQGRIEGRLDMNKKNTYLHPDRWVREESAIRVRAYTCALSDVLDIVELMKKGEL